MTVAEMISQLREMPQDATVVLHQTSGYTSDVWLNTVRGVERGDFIVRISEATDDERPKAETFVTIGA